MTWCGVAARVDVGEAGIDPSEVGQGARLAATGDQPAQERLDLAPSVMGGGGWRVGTLR